MQNKEKVFSAVTVNNALILLSGGIDSAACLNYYLKNNYSVETLFVDYGQISAQREKLAAEKITKHYGIRLKKICFKGLGDWKDGYIQGRNGFLLYTGLLTFSFPAGVISLGIHSSTTYPDCSEYFVNQMQATFDIYTAGRIQIDAPFVKWTKQEIWKYCQDEKVPLQFAYSCEFGLNQPCGKCISCLDLEALNAR